jgi:hypothetical protein
VENFEDAIECEALEATGERRCSRDSRFDFGVGIQ